jgi:integrase
MCPEVKGSRWHALYVCALMLGLRLGELLGLRWEDVDLDAAILAVRQNSVRVDGELRYQPPKTRRSRRTLPLPAPLVTALREHKVRQAADRLALGPGWIDTGLVFTTRLGTPIEPRNLTRHFYGVRARAGLAGVRFHDLRHTCITLLLNLGVPPHTVQAIAGHSHINVTMAIYAHVVMTEQERALKALGDEFGEGR